MTSTQEGENGHWFSVEEALYEPRLAAHHREFYLSYYTMPVSVREEAFKKKAMENKVSRYDINKAVDEAGGLDFTRQIINRYYKKAEKNINRLNITAEKQKMLKAILQKASGMKAEI